MKVAGSSWRVGWPACLFLCALIVVSNLLSVIAAKNPSQPQCLSLDVLRKTPQQWDLQENLIEELAEVSDEVGGISGLLDNLLKPYDATPFWYNLIQAISLASDITPTTKALMHDLVTSSFKSDNLNTSLKNVLTFIKCTDGSDKKSKEVNDPNEDSLGDKTAVQTGRDEDGPLMEQFADGAAAGISADEVAESWSFTWDQEQEVPGNSLLGE